ncbi:MAG: hypothetical protein E7184_00230 [Erysipelotrichaceae bacterium]|nr:hypothetical protein [Erysipelotrichaceae bacterium]
MKKKISSVIFIAIGLLGLGFLFYHAISFEKIAMLNLDLYVPVNTNNNIGGWNFFAYFTFLSNFLVDVYLILLGIGRLGNKKLLSLAYNPYIQGCLTVYIFITGVIYWTILGPHILLYPWDGPMAFGNIVNFWNHLIMPLFMTVLWFFPFNNRGLNKKFIYLTLIFPFAYYVFSLIRGVILEPNWFPYPFISPRYLWTSLLEDKPFEILKGYSLYLLFLFLIFCLFVMVSKSLVHFRNKRIKNKCYDLTYDI